MSDEKRKVRTEFRLAVFERDGFTCRACGARGKLDAHHIMPRENFENGGYVVENGISLCVDVCHVSAENALKYGDPNVAMSPIALYELIDSSLGAAKIADKARGKATT